MEWISVNFRLPQKMYSVLWADIDGNVGEGFIDYESIWRNSGDHTILENVTHWGKLPEPPKK